MSAAARLLARGLVPGLLGRSETDEVALADANDHEVLFDLIQRTQFCPSCRNYAWDTALMTPAYLAGVPHHPSCPLLRGVGHNKAPANRVASNAVSGGSDDGCGYASCVPGPYGQPEYVPTCAANTYVGPRFGIGAVPGMMLGAYVACPAVARWVYPGYVPPDVVAEAIRLSESWSAPATCYEGSDGRFYRFLFSQTHSEVAVEVAVLATGGGGGGGGGAIPHGGPGNRHLAAARAVRWCLYCTRDNNGDVYCYTAACRASTGLAATLGALGSIGTANALLQSANDYVNAVPPDGVDGANAAAGAAQEALALFPSDPQLIQFSATASFYAVEAYSANQTGIDQMTPAREAINAATAAVARAENLQSPAPKPPPVPHGPPPPPKPQPGPPPPQPDQTPSSSSATPWLIAAAVAATGAAAVVGIRMYGHRGRAGARENPALHAGSSHVQTLVFDKAMFTAQTARAWALGHGFKAEKVHETEHSYRIRQRSPSAFDPSSFRTKTFRPGVSAVVGWR